MLYRIPEKKPAKLFFIFVIKSIHLQELGKVLIKLKKGDRNAYRFLYDTFYSRLYLFSLKYVKNTYDAEEIVVNTFLQLWQKREDVDKINNIKTYLYTIVRNASYDYLKQKDKIVRFDVNSHDSTVLMNEYIFEEEVHALIIKALESLPAKCREVFKLSCIEGLKYKDIAEDLQITVNTVKSQRARAIELLKIKLKKYPFLLLVLSGL